MDLNIVDPHIWVWHPNSSVQIDLGPTDGDDFGLVFDVEIVRPTFYFKFKSRQGTAGPWEANSLERVVHPPVLPDAGSTRLEIWCFGDRAFVHYQRPRKPELQSAETFLRTLEFKKTNLFIPGSGGFSGLGANLLADGRVLLEFTILMRQGST
jgi:hypothetical protein